MRKLELKYEIKNISRLYEETTASWDNAEFTFHKDFTGDLRLWGDGVEPEQISETLRKLEERAESFRTALKYLGNRLIDFRKHGRPTYYFDEHEFRPKTEKEIAIITDYLRGRREFPALVSAVLPMHTVHITTTFPPAPLPQNMPSIPTDLHRMAETLVAAEELVKYPDLIIKLAYLILEELEGTPSDEFRYVRNFVSHPICCYTPLVNFIEGEMPSAITVHNGTDAVRFIRNDNDHMAFVAKYAYPALQRAKKLFNEKVDAEGGFLRG